MPRAVAAVWSSTFFSAAAGFSSVAKVTCFSVAGLEGLLFMPSARKACSAAANIACLMTQDASLPTPSSVMYSAASFAGVAFSALNVALMISRLVLWLSSLVLPKPTSSTRSAAMPGSLCRSSVDADLPLMSPRAMRSLNACLAALSSTCAAADNLPPSNTPTTTQPLFSFSGLPCFMLNSTRFSSLISKLSQCRIIRNPNH